MVQKVHIIRVKPDKELLTEINRYCNENNISTGIVVGIIGSLKNATLSYLEELPGKYKNIDYKGPLEIVCAQGSIALKDTSLIIHIHMQICRQDNCYGGHLASAIIFSTAEVAIMELDYQLRRQFNSYTGLNELIDKSG